MDLAWGDTSSNEQGFRIERRSSGTFVVIGATGAGAVAYSDTSLATPATYYYRVSAFNAVGQSAYSNTAEATVTAPVPAIAAPSGLFLASGPTSTQVFLAWTDNSDNEAGFTVERSRDNTTFSQVGLLVAGTSAYTDTAETGLAPATTYYYRVFAYGARGASQASNVISTTTQTAGVYSVGGVVSGLTGTLVLLNNGADELTLTTNASFTFSAGVTDGTFYNVTVGAQPSGLTCLVSNGTGWIRSADVADAAVACESVVYFCNTGKTCCSWADQNGYDACITAYEASVTASPPDGNLTLLPCVTPMQIGTMQLTYNPGEVCDNVDNNCDNQADESMLRCGNPSHCPVVEACNGRDDDCNEQIDEGGVCAACVWSPEWCDGCDNDCDSIVGNLTGTIGGVCSEDPYAELVCAASAPAPGAGGCLVNAGLFCQVP